jgi:hypothetical protein
MFTLIGNSILEIKGLTWSYWLILFSTACFANMLGLNISSGLNSVVAIYVLIPLILVPHLLFSGVIVSFDKLHKSIASEEYVPGIGDVMVSRWSYEALAVNQFKNNDFDAVFFDEEQGMSNASYYGTTFIPELINLVEAARWASDHDETDRQIIFQKRLNDAVKQLRKEFPDLFPRETVRNSENPWTDDRLDNMEKVLKKAREYFNKQYQVWNRMRNKKMENLIHELGSAEAVVSFKNIYHNEAISDLMLNKNSVEQFVYSNGKYIRKKHPGYEKPRGKWGRSHFYAPEKRFGGLTLQTPIFNIIVVWLGVGLLYVTLYFDLLRRIIRYFETFRLRRLHRKLQKLGT